MATSGEEALDMGLHKVRVMQGPAPAGAASHVYLSSPNPSPGIPALTLLSVQPGTGVNRLTVFSQEHMEALGVEVNLL